MQPFRCHVLVTQTPEVADALRAELAAQRLAGEVQVTAMATPADVPGFVRALERPPDELMAALGDFQHSRVVLTAVELDVFTTVGKGATAAAVAARLGTNARATEMLLNALAALGLLAKSAGVFRNGPLAARYLTANSPDDARGAVMHRANLWRRWSTLTECVRAGTAVLGDDLSQRGPDWTESFIAAMHHNALERAPQVVAAVGAGEVRRMLDVGGGSGAYSIAFAQANPVLRAEVLDLPQVLAIARRHIAEAGLSDRVETRAGDLRADAFGSGYDLVLLSAICHMLSEADNRALLRRAFDAVAPGGRIVIQDFILDPDKAGPRMAALFALNMLVGTRDGNTYNEAEYTAWLRAAGCREVRRAGLPGPADLIVGHR